MTENTPPVSVENLTKRFNGFTAVDRVSFTVDQGEIFGFLGPNGAGKSTTIKMICGLYVPTSGSGTVAGFDITSQQQQIKQHIGYMSQSFSLYEDLNVRENIRFYSRIYGISSENKQAVLTETLRRADLEDQRDRLTADLPRGWKQRLALSCAVMHDPPILFLDEPTSGVDPTSRRTFWNLIYDLSDQGMTIFVTTHYMEEAEYCDRLGLISRGELIALGTPQSLKTEMMKPTVLEIECDRPQEAQEAMRGLEGLHETALFGRKLHLVVDERPQLEEEVATRLESSGIGRSSLKRVPPTMEDVFVYLVQAETSRDSDSDP